MSITLEDRVDHLSALLGEFIVSTNAMLIRAERVQEEFKQEMKVFKDEMKDFKNEMKDFKDEMKDFKDEMKDFKDDTESDRRRMNKQWGELANKMGTIVEDIVAPNIPRIAEEYFHINTIDFFAVRIKKRHAIDKSLLREFDVIAVSEKYFLLDETKSTPKIDYINDFIETLPEEYFHINTIDFFAVRIKKRHAIDKSLLREFDVIAVSEKYFLLDETKSTPKIDYINDFIETLPHVMEYFPEYNDRILLPIFSSLYLPPQIVEYLSAHKIYALGMSDETMDILNFAQLPFQT